MCLNLPNALLDEKNELTLAFTLAMIYPFGNQGMKKSSLLCLTLEVCMHSYLKSSFKQFIRH